MLSCLQAFHFLKTDMEKVFEKISSRSITNASFTKINDDDSFVNVVYSQYDLHQQKKCTYSMNYSTCKKKPTCTLPMESNVHIIPSPSGKVSLHWNVDEKDSSSKSTKVKVWNEGGLLASYTLASEHGALYPPGDRTGTCVWSSDETHVAYIAERNAETHLPFWPKENNGIEKKDEVGYALNEDWGEGHVGQMQGDVFILNVSNGKVNKVCIPNHLHCLDVQWSPGNKGLIFTGYDNTIKYGLAHCFNRKCALYYVEMKEDMAISKTIAVCLTPKDATARSPRVSPDGRWIAYLSTEAVVTHNTCSALRLLAWNSDGPSKSPRTLVDIVRESNLDDKFSGLYAGGLPKKCWSGDSTHLFFNTLHRSRPTWYMVSVTNGSLLSDSEYPEMENYGSAVFWDASETHLLIEVASPDTLPGLVLLPLKKEDEAVTIVQPRSSPYIASWTVVQMDPTVPLQTVQTPAPTTPSTDLPQVKTLCTSDATYEAILCIPASTKPKNGWPLLLDIHGGPHGAAPSGYKTLNAFYAAHGIAICIVNYRGSIGFGKKALESLVGRAGTQDVHDVQRAMEHFVLSENSPFDAKRVFATGGSHGGFITCHLIGQFPAVYRAAAVRNPVTNVATQFFTSDIPLWGCAVSGVTDLAFAVQPEYSDVTTASYSETPLASSLMHFLAVSPMGNDLTCIKTPILFGLGGKDRRVPATEGLQMYKCLKALGVPTSVLWYPNDGHPLSSPEAYGDYAVRSLDWLLQY